MSVYAYNTYEAFVNGVVGVVLMYIKHHRGHTKEYLMYGAEKALINVISSYASVYAVSGQADALDTEYLLSAVLAGLYHSKNSMGAAGDQLLVSIISHLISNMSSTAGTSWFQRNVYGTPATAPSGGGLGGIG